MPDYRTLLVPFDFSENAQAALDTAVDLARQLKSDCHLVHVVQSYPYMSYGGIAGQPPLPPPDMLQIREHALESMGKVVKSVEIAGGRVVPHVVEDASVAGAICQMAGKLEADLIVMGTHGRTGIAHVFLGSVAERTLRQAPCPVLIVPSRDASKS